MKKSLASQLKKKLDATFSLWVRNRGSKDGYNQCYTCGITKPIKQLQCGHYVSRTALSTRWDEDNARPQCMPCNVFQHGNMVEYSLLLEQESPGITKRLRDKGRQIKKFSISELKEAIEKYTL